MPRRPRPEIPGGTFHIYARGNRKQDLFHQDADRRQYLVHLAIAADTLGWEVLAYCLMRNHVHLLIRTPRPNRCSGMRDLHAGYARYYNDTHSAIDHLFLRPYGYTVADNPGTAMYLACYVLLNPVRAGLCARPEEHPWSTLGPQPGPAPLATDHLEALFGTRARLAQVLEAVRILGLAGFEPFASPDTPTAADQ